MKKPHIILHILLLILLSSLVSAIFDDPVIVYDFNQNYNTTNLTNQVDAADNLSTAVKITAKVTGINNDAWDFETGSVDLVTINQSSIAGMGAMAINVWVNPESTVSSGGGRIYMCEETSGHITTIHHQENGVIRYCINAQSSSESCTITSANLSIGNWNMITMIFDGNNQYLYHNETLIDVTNPTGSNIVCDNGAWIGSIKGSTNGFDGLIDEMYFYNHNLTQADITSLYASGTGAFYPSFGVTIPATPTIQPPSPVDNSNNNTNVTLNVSHSSTLNDVRYYLYFNTSSSLNEGDLIYNNVTRNGSEYSAWKTNSPEGTYFWKWRVQNITNGAFSSNTTVRTLIIDTVSPTITLNGNHNISTLNTTILSNYLINLSINLSFFDINLFQTLINITNESDESSFQILNTSIVGNTTANYSRTIDIRNWSIGNYTLKLIATDSHTTNVIDKYGVIKGLDYLRYTTAEGNIIKIESNTIPLTFSTTKYTDRYDFKFNYLLLKSTYKFKISSYNKIDYLPSSEYAGHFVVWGNNAMGNWIDFNPIEKKDIVVTKLDDYTYEVEITSNGQKSFEFNSIGGLNRIQQDYKFQIGSVLDIWVFDEETSQGLNATATIGTQVAHSTGNKTPATLINITKETTTVTLNASGYGSETKTISITENFHNLSLNMTVTSAIKGFFFDEKSNTLITGETFSVFLERTGFSQTISTSSNPHTFTNLASGIYKLKASSSNYPERQYLDLNVSNETTTNINIYLINSTLGSEVTFNIVSEDGLAPLEDVRTVFTKIINGTRTIVAEEDSDFAGQVILNLDSNTEYTINFSKTDYEDKTISLEPTDSDYIIQMVSTVGAYNQSVHEGIRYRFSPINTVLKNNTPYNFTFTLNSTVWSVTNCNLTLKNGSAVLSTTSGFTSNSCGLTIEQNTFGMTNITSEAVYELDDQFAFTVSQQYSVIDTYEGQFSLKNFLDDLSDFSMAGFDSFGRMMLAFITIFIILAFVSIRTGFENKEVLLFVLWGLVGFFSFIGWFRLDLGTMPNILGIKKWFIFYLVSMICIAFIIDKVRK